MKRGQGWSDRLCGDRVQGLHPLTHPTLLSQPSPRFPRPPPKRKKPGCINTLSLYSSEDPREPGVERGREKQGQLSGQAWGEKP